MHAMNVKHFVGHVGPLEPNVCMCSSFLCSMKLANQFAQQPNKSFVYDSRSRFHESAGEHTEGHRRHAHHKSACLQRRISSGSGSGRRLGWRASVCLRAVFPCDLCALVVVSPQCWLETRRRRTCFSRKTQPLSGQITRNQSSRPNEPNAVVTRQLRARRIESERWRPGAPHARAIRGPHVPSGLAAGLRQQQQQHTPVTPVHRTEHVTWINDTFAPYHGDSPEYRCAIIAWRIRADASLLNQRSSSRTTT